VKRAVLVGSVGVAFALGVGAGVALHQGSAPAPSAPRPRASLAAGTTPAAGEGRVRPPGQAASGPETAGRGGATAGDEPAATGASPDGPAPPDAPATAPAEPDPTPGPDAHPGPAGPGSPTEADDGPAAPDAPDMAEAAAAFERRKAGWIARERYRQDIRVRGLAASLRLTPGQEGDLRDLLERTLVARTDLAERLAVGEVEQAEFYAAKAAALEAARDELDQLLTPAQREAYGELKPADQVLRDDLQ